MKKVAVFFLTLCTSLFGFSQNSRIMQVAQNNLKSYLEVIPAGLEQQHGFHNRAEFAKVTLGSLYQITALDKEGRITPTGFFYVVVSVDNEFRALLTVGEVNGKTEIQSVGASILAHDLQVAEEKEKVAADARRVLLNDYINGCSFVTYNEQNKPVEDGMFIPLSSARSFLGLSDDVQPSYSLPELAKSIPGHSR
ncbi:MAG: hypothetical protein KDD36_02150 [Flavobacteriales bacterium]|nr:hypothetical protein [Flavobacteriales bacterium]